MPVLQPKSRRRSKITRRPPSSLPPHTVCYPSLTRRKLEPRPAQPLCTVPYLLYASTISVSGAKPYIDDSPPDFEIYDILRDYTDNGDSLRLPIL